MLITFKTMRNILAIFFLLPIITFTQTNEDFGSWTKANFNLKLNKTTFIVSKNEIRTNGNSSNINQFYSQIELDKRINKKLSTSFAYRYRLLNKKYNFINNNRFHNDLTYKEKMGDFSLYFRLRTQYNFDPIGWNDFYERTRLKLKYKFNKKSSFYIYNEFYFLMNDVRSNTNFNKNRFGVGLKHRLNSNVDLQIKYLRISDLNVENPLKMNILGIGISCDI